MLFRSVSAFRYLPFAIFCYASPALSVLYGITGFKIEKIAPAGSAGSRESPDAARDGPAGPGADIPDDDATRAQ